MIQRRKFLKLSLVGTGTIFAGINLAEGKTKNVSASKSITPPYVPTAEFVSSDELKKKENFVSKYILNGEEFPFSFTYNGMPSYDFLKKWVFKNSKKEIDAIRTEHTLIWRDSETKLQVKLSGIEYMDFPVVEWTMYFTNESKSDSPVLENIQALDIQLTRPEEKAVDLRYDQTGEAEFILHHHVGDIFRNNNFAPLRTRLEFNSTHHFAPIGGRPSNGTFPYFNLQWGGNEGMIFAIGWPGQWAADLVRDDKLNCNVTACQETTHFKLLPGETVRTPLIALLFYKGDNAHSQNTWRRWMLAHNLSKKNGKLLQPMAAACMGFNENEKDEKKFIDQYVGEKAGLTHWWMDAGWYHWEDDKEGWGTLKTGTWKPDPVRFPKGLRPISDYAHSKGLKYILWYEPERVSPGTELYEKKEWLLHLKPGHEIYRNEQNTREQRFVDNEAERNQLRKGDALYNMGNDDACEYLTKLISKTIFDFNLDIFRLDFNISPLKFWQDADTPGREGITENKYVTGYLKFLDDLYKLHPNIFMDTSASGGRRIDLETMRRMVPLNRTDFQGQAAGNQNHTYGLASWIPYFGTGIGATDIYSGRTAMGPCFGLGIDKNDWNTFRQLTDEWKQIADYYCGDYYTLTSYSLEDDVWMSWQFNRPDIDEGFAQVFRRSLSPFTNARFRLMGLKEDVKYSIINLDKKDQKIEKTGKELMQSGLDVAIDNTPGSSIIIYKKKK
jgi:alpha-galactosidase